MGDQRGRGRPTATHTTAPADADVLDGALEAFAESGFAGMSVRELARRLGVSHNLIPQRFGSKERLWYAAVDHGFGLLHLHLLTVIDEPLPDDLSRLRALVVRFVEANATRPALLRIINQESVSGGPRLDYLFTRYIEPVRQFGDTVLEQLHAQGRVQLQSAGIMYFLMTNGAGGPLIFPGLADRLGAGVDPADPKAVRAYAEHVVDVLFDGISRPSA
jgi:TetR/AcrR family transcriptional regulator